MWEVACLKVETGLMENYFEKNKRILEGKDLHLSFKKRHNPSLIGTFSNC